MLGDEIYNDIMNDADFLGGQLPAVKYYKFAAECQRIIYESDRMLYYASCPDCRKKVNPEGEEGFRCENCNRVFSDCKYLYNFTARVGDFSNSFYVQFLGDIGDQLLGIPAKQLKEMKEGNG